MPVAAVLRALYMLVVVPASDRVKIQVFKELRDLATLRRLMAILDTVSLLACNCCAKFLRLLARVLLHEENHSLFAGGAEVGAAAHGAGPPRRAADDQKQASSLILFDVVCSFLKKIGGSVLHLLRSTRSRHLTEPEKALCTELARAVAVIMKNVPYVRFSALPSVQRHFENACLVRILPPVMIRSCVAMVLYDLQSSGSGNKMNWTSWRRRDLYAARPPIVVSVSLSTTGIYMMVAVWVGRISTRERVMKMMMQRGNYKG